MNIHIHHYGDLEMLKECVESIDIDVPIIVIDGRYCTFMPGKPVLTPGSREWCDSQKNVLYFAPNEDRLPFGEGLPKDVERPGVMDKAKFANYEVLPQDEWTLRMDTDERLERFDVDLDELDPEKKYEPFLLDDSMRESCQPRLMIPGKWTFWINDVCAPREKVSIHCDERLLAEKVKEHHEEGAELIYSKVRLRNVGMHRPDEYIEERVAHLKSMGREQRAKQLDLINKNRGDLE